jgi:hypothetical protein
VDRAGRAYVDPASSPADRDAALLVINNWRSSHSYPLNTWQTNLRHVTRGLDPDPTVAQRIKRLPSIRHKLERFDGMQLSRMQDIGGCRAVMSSVDGVRELLDYYTTRSRIKHKPIRQDLYIDMPKPSGYRGVHLVYSYNSDRNEHWNELKTEIQLRSRLQHSWATAVETVGTFTRQALKSSLGEEEWLRFFALMSSAHALREGTPTVPGTPEDAASLRRELRLYVRRLDVVNRLATYGRALRFTEEPVQGDKDHTYLLQLDVSDQSLMVAAFDNAAEAAEIYGNLERESAHESSIDVVMVSVESLTALRRAFPNYFLDTTAFLDSVKEAVK